MRFTPNRPCNLDSVRVCLETEYATTCSLFVWNVGEDTLPDVANPRLVMSYKTKDGDGMTGVWQTINLTSALKCSTDFWVGIYITTDGTGYPISRIDSILNFRDRMAWEPQNLSVGWSLGCYGDLGEGDFRLRAEVSDAGVDENGSTSGKLTLANNFPNPVKNKTTISYTIPQTAKVKLEIYDITGSIIKTLVNELQAAGNKEIVWDRTNDKRQPVASGIYFYTLSAGNSSFTKTLIVL